MSMESHPLANWLPLMEGADWESFKADIKTNGVRDPIILHEGKILDGRHRWRAAQESGIECQTTNFAGSDPLAFVMSANLHRRHLSTSQRAEIAARMATACVGNPKFAIRTNDRIEPPMTNVEAAKLLNVSEKSVRRAKKALSEPKPESVKKERLGSETRVKQISQMVDAGNNVNQIADALLLSPERVRALVRDHSIAHPSTFSTKHRHIKLGVVVEQTTNSLVGLAQGIETIRGQSFDCVTSDQATEMLREIRRALASINWLMTQLKEVSK